MRKEQKSQLIDSLAEQLTSTSHIYITDTSELNAEDTSNLRRLCFSSEVKLTVVKNTLLRKAMERSEKEFEGLYEVLKGSSSVMFSEVGNAPAKLIKEFRKTSDKPILKGAYVEESIYVGDESLETLVNIKSKDELIGDIITLLQSPAKNVISALQSGGQKISGILETLSEKAE
ncbi:MAG: 50S ribosomal protein L10 [Hyphomicrobiales bacterium]